MIVTGLLLGVLWAQAPRLAPAPGSQGQVLQIPAQAPVKVKVIPAAPDKPTLVLAVPKRFQGCWSGTIRASAVKVTAHAGWSLGTWHDETYRICLSSMKAEAGSDFGKAHTTLTKVSHDFVRLSSVTHYRTGLWSKVTQKTRLLCAVKGSMMDVQAQATAWLGGKIWYQTVWEAGFSKEGRTSVDSARP